MELFSRKEMEVNQQQFGDAHLSVASATPEAAALDIIRTETVLSRLPVHNLAKKGSISIQIVRKTEAGEIELLWRVSPSRDYGEPRQLAYKLDTIVINQRIDEAGRPLPKLLRLGSLNEICTELGIVKLGGKSKNELKRAFFQNVGALITAKFNYRANDGTERRLEAAFTRYSVIFTGEKLPDGRKADAVYVILNEPFWEVLNSAPVRPLDRAYMKELTPASQRFYEIISRKIFAALKNGYPHAKIAYSEYCTFSAQVRHYERQRAQDQIAKVLRAHKSSGYITAVRYEPTIDAENKPDWMLYLTPGPKAHEEFAAAHGRRPRRKAPELSGAEPRENQAHNRHRGIVHSETNLAPTEIPPKFDSALVGEFTKRGIAERKAIELLTNLKPGQDVVAQLELGEYMAKNSHTPIVNPPGFYIRLITSNTSVPDTFETSAKRKAREEREREEREARAKEDARQQLEWDYEDYAQRETSRYIDENPAEFKALYEAKRVENRNRFPSVAEDMITTMASVDAKRDIRKQLSLLPLDEFADQRKQGVPFSLKPVPVSPPAEAAAATRNQEPLSQEAPAVITTRTEPLSAPQADAVEISPTARSAATPETATEEEMQPAGAIEPDPIVDAANPPAGTRPEGEDPPSAGRVNLLAPEFPPGEEPGADPIGPTLV